MTGPVLLVLRILLTLALYAFLAGALWVLWKDLRRQSVQPGAVQIQPVTLIFTGGDERKFYQFRQGEVTLGRDPTSDCHLDELTISARHARLSYHHNHWWIEDLNSTNGTYLNQAPVLEPLVITNGDELRLGQLIFSVSFDPTGETDHPAPASPEVIS